MSKYLKILSVFYGFGALLHLLDLFDLRLIFSEMSFYQQVWIIFLFIFDTIAAVGLWKGSRLGVSTFLLVTFSQLFVYTVFRNTFGGQWLLIIFHLVTLGLYCSIKINKGKLLWKK